MRKAVGKTVVSEETVVEWECERQWEKQWLVKKAVRRVGQAAKGSGEGDQPSGDSGCANRAVGCAKAVGKTAGDQPSEEGDSYTDACGPIHRRGEGDYRNRVNNEGDSLGGFASYMDRSRYSLP